MNTFVSLTVLQEKKLLAALRRRTDAWRDYMLIHLALKTGLRREELRGLNVGDLFETDELKVRAETAKRSKARKIPLNKEIQAHIKQYLAKKKKRGEGLQDDAPFFMSRNGNRLCKRAVNDVIAKWCKETGLKGFSPHSLRHSFAMRILERAPEGAEKVLARLQRLLGHSSLASTGIYLKPSSQDLKETVEWL